MAKGAVGMLLPALSRISLNAGLALRDPERAPAKMAGLSYRST